MGGFARRLSLALLFALGGSTLAFGAGDLPLRQFVRKAWTTDEGLPQSSVNAIAQTTDGYLWIATSGGLARFDGLHFEVFDPASRPPLPVGRILALLADPDGGLWIGTEGDGLWRERDGTFTRIETQPPLAGAIWALARGADGALWLGTDQGAASVRGADPARFEVAAGLAAGTWVRALAFAADGTLWAATDRGTAAFEQGRFLSRGTQRPVWALAAPAGGGLIAVTERGDLVTLSGTPPPFQLGDLAPIAPRGALFARDGSLWIGGLGLARVAGGRLRIAPIEAGIVDSQVRTLFEDREGTVWLGLDGGGLVRLRPGRVVTYGWNEGLGATNVLPLLEDRDGALWIGGNCGGLWRLRQGVIAPRAGADGRSLDCVRALAETADGALWVAHGGGLDRLGPGASRRFGRADGLPDLSIHALAEDRRGTLWVAGDFGIVRSEGERFAPPSPAPPRALAGAQALHLAPDGALWVGFTAGVAVLRDGVWQLFDEAGGLPPVPVRDLLDDGRGALWAATYGGGLVRLAGGRAQRLGTAAGLPDHYLSRLLDDGQGSLWITGNRGVYRVAWADLEAVAAGTRSAVAPLVLHSGDGMPSSECSGGGQPAGWRGRDGRLWIPTVRGVVAIDPAAIPARVGAAPAAIAEVRLDGRRLPLSGGELRLPAGADQLEVRYTALSFVAPESVRFRYRLAGHDTDWTDAGGSRIAIYRRLPPGGYVFEVTAAGDDGRFGGRAATLAFRVAPRFYETGWFRLAAIATPLLAALLAHGLRTAHLKRRQVELGQLVEARTGELTAEKQRADRQVELLAHKEAELAELNRDLERRVAAQTTQIRLGRDVAMLTLARLAELRDDATGRHLDRIAAFSRELARAAVVSAEDTLGFEFIEHLYRSSPLHDIGKVAVPDAILRKPGPLTAAERKVVESHTTIGGDTLRDIVERFDNHRFFEMGMEIAYHHHERWDGTGYPHGLAGEGIPLSARIVAIVDAYDAITSERPYKPAESHEEAIGRIVADRGSHFDPALVDSFVAIAGRIDELRERLAR